MKFHISVLSRFWSFELANELVAKGHEVVLSTGYPRFLARKKLDKKIKLETFPLLGTFSLFIYRFFPKQAYHLEFSLVDSFDRMVAKNIQSELDVFIGWSGCSLHTMKRYQAQGTKTILERGSPHIRWEFENIAGVQTPTSMIDKEEAEYAMSDAIHVPSTFAKRTYPKFLSDKVHVVPFGVDTSFFEVRESAKKAHDQITFCFIGMMNRRKGVDLLVEACQKLPEKLNYQLLLIGAEVEISAPRNHRQIQYLGTKNRAEIREILNASDCLILPSRSDGWGLVITEALSCGTPVICTDQVGAADLVLSNPDFGQVIPTGSTASLLSAMLKVETVTFESRMRRSAMVKSQTSWEAYATRKCASMTAQPAND